jgi:hypothetical protein
MMAQAEWSKIWGFHGSGYEEHDFLYVPATEYSQLTLCKIWGFHGSDYEECRLLGYKNPFRTSQETHYFSTTESELVNAM